MCSHPTTYEGKLLGKTEDKSKETEGVEVYEDVNNRLHYQDLKPTTPSEQLLCQKITFV